MLDRIPTAESFKSVTTQGVTTIFVTRKYKKTKILNLHAFLQTTASVLQSNLAAGIGLQPGGLPDHTRAAMILPE